MKNRHFFYMAVALCCTVFFGACNKDNDFVDFGASITSYANNGSKVWVDGGADGTHFAYWHQGDKVMINGREYSVTLSNDDDDQVAAINGVAVNTSGYYAIYPCDKIVDSSNSGYPTILLPQVQIYDKDPSTQKQIIRAPMAAYSLNTGRRMLNFTNLCSLIEVTLPVSKDVAYIQVTSNNHYLWGEATISGESSPSLTINDTYMKNNYYTDNHTVILDCSTNGSNGSNTGGAAADGTQSAGPFFVVVPANNYENLKVEVYVYENGSDNYRRVVKRYSASATIPAGSTTVSTNVVSNNIYYIAMPNSTETVQPSYPGLGTGEFSVSSTKKVRFSQGNLQYKNGVWRFATDELESFRNASNHNLVTTNRDQNWIDLFGFGTSGQGSLSTTSTPNLPTTYTNAADYYPHVNLTGANRYDWGVNEICNGGNQPDRWRTLTKDEWQYLLGNSPNRRNKNVLAVIDGNITGLVIAPDGCSVASGWSSVTTVLRITQQQYISTYQSVGCVFLPVTGYYSQANDGVLYMYDCSNSTPVGWYWTSTYEQPKPWAAKVVCSTNGGGVQFAGQEIVVYQGCAVRLVRDVD